MALDHELKRRQFGDFQLDIYLDGLDGKAPRYPVDFAGAKGGRGASLVGALLTSPEAAATSTPNARM